MHFHILHIVFAFASVVAGGGGGRLDGGGGNGDGPPAPRMQEVGEAEFYMVDDDPPSSRGGGGGGSRLAARIVRPLPRGSVVFERAVAVGDAVTMVPIYNKILLFGIILLKCSALSLSLLRGTIRPMVTGPPFFHLLFVSPIFVYFAKKVNPRCLQSSTLFFCSSWSLLSPPIEESIFLSGLIGAKTTLPNKKILAALFRNYCHY